MLFCRVIMRSAFNFYQAPYSLFVKVYLNIGGLRVEDMVDGKFLYDGSTRIYAEVQEDTCQIVLHADFDVMQIDTVFLTIEDQDAEIVFDFNLEKKYIRITPVVPLLAQSKIEIVINFKVVVPTGTDGLYLSFYDDAETGTVLFRNIENFIVI